MTPDPYAQWDAAYVMGSLSSTERRDYESHLQGCDECRAAVSELSGMPALLALLSRDDVAEIDTPAVQPPVPSAILDSLLSNVGARRRRSRALTWSIAAVAAAALVAVVALVAVGPVTSEPAQPTALEFTMSHVVPSTFEATFSLTEHAWGTRIEMSCTYAESPEEHEDSEDADELALVVVGSDGIETVLSTWLAHSGQTAWPTASTALSVEEISAVRIVEIGSSEVLLQRDL